MIDPLLNISITSEKFANFLANIFLPFSYLRLLEHETKILLLFILKVKVIIYFTF